MIEYCSRIISSNREVKGQLISAQNFGVFMKLGQKSVKNLVGFLGDLKIPKFHSEIKSPLVHIGGFFSKPLTKNVISSLAY